MKEREKIKKEEEQKLFQRREEIYKQRGENKSERSRERKGWRWSNVPSFYPILLEDKNGRFQEYKQDITFFFKIHKLVFIISEMFPV